MQKQDGAILFSASDMVNFLECEHLTTLDLINLETPMPRAEDDDEAILYQNKGFAHELSYVEHLKNTAEDFVDLSKTGPDRNAASKATIEAMQSGVEIIYQATLTNGCLVGHADFLKRVRGRSALGDFGYEVVDTKLAHSAKAKFIVQLCFYSELLALGQGRDPIMMHVVLGDRTEESFRYANYSRYYGTLKKRFLDRVGEGPGKTYPEKREHCGLCRWRTICDEQWTKDDHLNQVANISRIQIKKLCDAGIETLEALANCKKNFVTPKMTPETFEKLRHQALLQFKKRQTGQDIWERLPLDPDRKRGFARLPEPDDGDIFFDMESDALAEAGLEYLFGVYYFEKKKPVFLPIWAHNREEEKAAFIRFMDFVTVHLRRYPGAHIYHYANYEEAALKKLMSLHGVCEAQVDNLLRQNTLVDLYKVVREAIRISEPRYSIKNVEHFYLGARTGAVKNAGASVVYYERWKETGDGKLLKEIEDYNRDDVVSTHGLREWLLKIRPKDLPWANSDPVVGPDGGTQGIDQLNELEKNLADYRESLTDDLPINRDDWKPEHHRKELTYQLLDFQRRSAKPVWWALFARSEMTREDLLEDAEAIADMRRDPDSPPYHQKQSDVYTYFYPEQEHKLKTGDGCVVTDTLAPVNNVVIDEEDYRVTFSYACKRGELPPVLSIGTGGPINSSKLTDAVFRFADSVINDNGRYRALKAILGQETPNVRGLRKGKAIINEARDLLPQVIETVANLNKSYIFIQGPPGSGKTYTGSHIIVDLIRRGFRVGISSNSHKAINNLLSHVERVALERKVTFRGAKKSTSNNEESEFGGKLIRDVFKNEDLLCEQYQLVAGTAWFFADEAVDGELDFLFVDEAGQVALANLVAMGTSAKNIVLLGDQMQLGQPIQGIHPGRSGESTLDYLLEGMATIPDDKGIFLPSTWRMHPDLCRFISDAVYDGRLQPEASTGRQCIVHGANAHPLLKPTGICYVPVEHDGCTQRSQEEADVVKELYESLLGQRYRDKKGVKRPMTGDNILVVAPYNMQVNLLKRVLPRGARVGTVDKFQGQEAEVVIVSMATSSGEYLPHNIEFLYSKNRLNVALSRARCLAVLIANPALMTIRCTTIEQMALVNTLCWVKDYSDG